MLPAKVMNMLPVLLRLVHGAGKNVWILDSTILAAMMLLVRSCDGS